MNPKQVNQEPTHWVLIPAAGVGSRMKSAVPKQYLKIFESTILEHTAKVFKDDSRFCRILIGLAPTDPYIDTLNLIDNERVDRFDGGKERVHTVLNGLNSIKDQANDDDWVWVHDAARPCLSSDDIDKIFERLASSGGANSDGMLLVAPLFDTIKSSDNGACIDGTLDRSKLWRALTPQVFRFRDLLDALNKCVSTNSLVTDEASAIEINGGRPLLIEGQETNIKVTRPRDIELARSYFSKLPEKENINVKQKPERDRMRLPKIGNGFDVHAFCEGDHLVLGGVTIPYSQAFAAHSDGDVLIHAIMDGLLGALSLGDIGKHFPDTDESYKGADSRELLRAVVSLIHERGYLIGNVDSVIIAQAPKMAPHISDMQENLAKDMDIDLDCVSVKATTSEKLGFTGRKEGIACQASVLLYPMNLGE